MRKYHKVILTDCDGVLLNWGYAFDVWMEQRGYYAKKGVEEYDVSKVYGIERSETKELVKLFNESAAIGFLPPLRDAVEYVRKLHEEHGYVFHVITSLSKDENAQKLRTKNLKKVFGKTAIEKFIYLDTGADKDEVLSEYVGKGYIWVEDKVENAICGDLNGLESILMEHAFNMDNKVYPLMKNWKDIYEYVTGE